jgi:hypothetical protein
MDVRISNNQEMVNILSLLPEDANITTKVIHSNVQEFLNLQHSKQRTFWESAEAAVQDIMDPTWFDDYHPYPEIVTAVKKGCTSAPKLCKFVPSIGKTIEGRDIFAVRITNSERNSKKAQIYIQANQHAREHISTTTAQYLIAQLLNKYQSGDEEVKKLLNHAEIVLIPMANPDGYTYTWTTDRMWRKNRRQTGPNSWGVDINRNWGFKWTNEGGQGEKDSETYAGPKPYSEPETQALLKYFKSLPNAVAALDLHSFSQLLLRPFGYTFDDSPDEVPLKSITEAMSEKIKSIHGKTYQALKGREMYTTTGVARDTLYTSLSRDPITNRPVHPYVVTVELRPGSDDWEAGFILPKEQIKPVGEEIFPAFVLYANNAAEHPLIVTKKKAKARKSSMNVFSS